MVAEVTMAQDCIGTGHSGIGHDGVGYDDGETHNHS